jgi:hypothetical protein
LNDKAVTVCGYHRTPPWSARIRLAIMGNGSPPTGALAAASAWQQPEDQRMRHEERRQPSFAPSL